MNAIEARDLAYKVNVASVNSQYAKVKNEIEIAAGRGEYRAYIYESLNNDVENLLKEEGFKIRNDGHMNETLVTISW